MLLTKKSGNVLFKKPTNMHHGQQQITAAFAVSTLKPLTTSSLLHQSGTCRLKKHAIPSRSNATYTAIPLPDELQSRLEVSNKRPLPPTNHENLVPPAKVAKPLPAERRDELEEKLKQKIRNLQQQLRRSKQKAKTMGDVIKIMKEKLVISSKEAETLEDNFKDTHLEFLYNFKENLTSSPCRRRYTDEIKEFAVTLHCKSGSVAPTPKSV